MLTKFSRPVSPAPAPQGVFEDRTTGYRHLESGAAVLSTLCELADDLERQILVAPCAHFYRYGSYRPAFTNESPDGFAETAKDLSQLLVRKRLHHQGLNRRRDTWGLASPFSFSVNKIDYTHSVNFSWDDLHDQLPHYTFLEGQSERGLHTARSASVATMTLSYWLDWRSHTWYPRNVLDLLLLSLLPEACKEQLHRQSVVKKRVDGIQQEAYALLSERQVTQGTNYVHVDGREHDVSVHGGRFFLLQRAIEIGGRETPMRVLTSHHVSRVHLLLGRVIYRNDNEPLAYLFLKNTRAALPTREDAMLLGQTRQYPLDTPTLSL
jgi:hypothetical protein